MFGARGAPAVNGRFQPQSGLDNRSSTANNGVDYQITYRYNAEANNGNGQFGTGNDVALIDITDGELSLQPTVVFGHEASATLDAYGKTAVLSVLGNDCAGEDNLTYTWTVTPPQGASQPTFSAYGTNAAEDANGTNAAKETVATFSSHGTYYFTVTITNPYGFSVNAVVELNVDQRLDSITLTPSSSMLNELEEKQFTAVCLDQFGGRMDPTLEWSALTGSLETPGSYTAPATPTTDVVTAQWHGSQGGQTVTVLGTATVIVVNQTPTVKTIATVGDVLVNGTQISNTKKSLSVLGDDDAGETNLTYTWQAVPMSPYASDVTFDLSSTAPNTSASSAR